MKCICLIALPFSLKASMVVNSDKWIDEANKICGRFLAVEINGGDAELLLGWKDFGGFSSRIEVYCFFFFSKFLD